MIDMRLGRTQDDKRGLWCLVGDQMEVYTGQASLFEKVFEGNVQISSPEFTAFAITPLDGVALQSSQRILVTACGRCENTGMKFSEDRRTVGRNWGGAPVRIEAVSGHMVLPEGRWTVHALAPDGSFRAPVPVTYEKEEGTIVFSPRYGTMWYLLERQKQ